jgi:hypothetical protein
VTVRPELDCNEIHRSSHVIVRPYEYLDYMRQYHVCPAIALLQVAVFVLYFRAVSLISLLFIKSLERSGI